MRALLASVVSLLALVTGGCGSSVDDPREVSVPIYLIESASNRLDAVTRVVPASQASTPIARTTRAVEALMAADESGARYSSLWGEICGMGSGVESIASRTSESLVVVTLTGQGGAACDLSQEGHDLQVQQLVWTVVQNLGAPPGTAVRVVGPSDYLWVPGATADPSYLNTAGSGDRPAGEPDR